jgi:hypothetical protein
MAKSKHKQQPIPNRRSEPPIAAQMAPVQFGFDPKSRSESVDIVSSKDGWSEFTLADGTVIRAKAVLLDVKKLVEQYNTAGEPVYMMQMTMINQTRVPDNLKKKD